MRKYIFTCRLVCCLLIQNLFALPCGAQGNRSLFTRLNADQTGVSFTNTLTETAELNIITYEYFFNGGGVAVGDVNNDGLPDLYFSANMMPNRLYLNKGNMVFEDITRKAGVACEKGWKTGVTMADINADGLLDIYICFSGNVPEKERRNKLFINNGDLTFTEKAAGYGLALPDYSTQAAFLDYDRDGDLDMFLLDHNIKEVRNFNISALKGERDLYAGDRLMQNNGGKFSDVTERSGIISNPISFGLGIAVADINDDNWPDMYVSNDYREQDYLYVNNKDGTFSNRLEEMMGHVSNFSMGSDATDINNDGFTDIFTVDMLPEDNRRRKLLFAPDNYETYQAMLDSGFYHQLMRNMLQLNNGDGTFSEIGQLSGISNTDWSWSALFADFDNDGLKDLFITNGYGRDVVNRDFMKFYVAERFKSMRGVENKQLVEMLQKIPPTIFSNYIYRNEGGLRFSNRVKEWGLEHKALSNGAVYADLDMDGDLDLVVNNINETAGIYENHTQDLGKGHFLKVGLRSETANHFGIGSKVLLYSAGTVQQQEFHPTRGFQSAIHCPLHFGLPGSTIDSLKIIWTDGTSQVIKNIKADQLMVIDHKNAGRTFSPDAAAASLFTETPSLQLSYIHRENNFNDFKVQPLLTNMISYSGPRAAKGDFNGDGLNDLYFCGAKGQAGELFIQHAPGVFELSEQNSFKADSWSEDTDALFFDADGDKDMDLYVTSGGFNYRPGDQALQDRLYFNVLEGVLVKREQALPAMFSSSSCVAAADFDKDGDMDIFSGGRVIPGRYPETPESFLLQNDGKGHFSIVTDSLAEGLRQAGMVTDAVWTDVNDDTWVDLIVVGEWMPVKIYINRSGRLTDLSEKLLQEPSAGWWYRILAEDMDMDGDIDLVIGNLGLNSQVVASPSHPATLHYADFDRNGSVDPLMCYYIQGYSYPAASRDEITNQMVSLRKKFPDYASYANATIDSVLSPEQLAMATILKAERLNTSYLENTGNGFQFRELPVQADFAPVCALTAGDFNGDGHKDLLLAGNMEATGLKFGKYDAGYGIVLTGNGNGKFRYVPQKVSGFSLKGDVRDITTIDAGGRKFYIFSRNNRKLAVYQLNQQK